jgi:hypothetical protein
MVAMTKVIRWETGADPASFSRTLTPEEVMDKLEERVGPEGRKLFEKFIRQVNVLQAKQQLEAQAQDNRQRHHRTVKALSAAFLADLQEDWLAHGKEVFPILREKFPQAYFNGLVALSRVIRWEGDGEAVFDRTLTPDQIMERLEERVGPEGRKLFEKFIRQVNVLQAKQQLEAQAQDNRQRHHRHVHHRVR